MVFHKLDGISRDDAAVKLIFEHVRNLSIALGMLGASAWLQTHSRSGWAALWDHLSAAVVGFTGFGLVWINHTNLFSKLATQPLAQWVRVAFALLYAVALGALLRYLEKNT